MPAAAPHGMGEPGGGIDSGDRSTRLHPADSREESILTTGACRRPNFKSDMSDEGLGRQGGGPPFRTFG